MKVTTLTAIVVFLAGASAAPTGQGMRNFTLLHRIGTLGRSLTVICR